MRRPFVVLAASSALPFEEGKCADDILCRTPHHWKKFHTDISTETPSVTNRFLKAINRPDESALLVPDLIWICLIQTDS